jgi:hypothetical protein
LEYYKELIVNRLTYKHWSWLQQDNLPNKFKELLCVCHNTWKLFVIHALEELTLVKIKRDLNKEVSKSLLELPEELLIWLVKSLLTLIILRF